MIDTTGTSTKAYWWAYWYLVPGTSSHSKFEHTPAAEQQLHKLGTEIDNTVKSH